MESSRGRLCWIAESVLTPPIGNLKAVLPDLFVVAGSNLPHSPRIPR
jgi:hypothetical protein